MIPPFPHVLREERRGAIEDREKNKRKRKERGKEKKKKRKEKERGGGGGGRERRRRMIRRGWTTEGRMRKTKGRKKK